MAQLSPGQVAAALPSLGEALYALLDTYWPSGTGWGVSVASDANGTICGSDIGFPCDIELEGEGAVELALSRAGGTVTFSVEASQGGGGALVPTVKVIEMPCGTLNSVGQKMSLAIDLGAVKWPSGAWALLVNQDVRGAMSELLRTSVSIGDNAQTTTEVTANMEQSVGARGDVVAANVTAKLIAGLGLQVELVSPTMTKPGSLTVGGARWTARRDVPRHRPRGR